MSPADPAHPSRDLSADLAAAREDYTRGGLVESDLLGDPMAMFARWYDDARSAGVHEPNAMVVSTATPEGVPSSRIVLLKGVTDGPGGGFRFFTNTLSRKGLELAANPRVSLLFPWHPVERQVRVDGTATPLSPSDVADYFAVRPRGSQLGAWASHQSRPVADRDELTSSYAAAEARFDGSDVPVPDEWGGYLVTPHTVEFWQGRTSRLHDRLVYTLTDIGAWTTHRLAP